jgi:A/G-specific adenine glycosylase
MKQKFFSSALLFWNDTKNNRAMPWKGEKDPYKIWISEIILQQTRVQQGLIYYQRFIDAFPDVKTLANAPEKKIYKLWEGLGYYSRCKNLIATAKFIHENLDGKFPEKYEDILSLKGIGSYTASAIASFAFNEPYAVLDGNVFRVLSRFFGKEIPVNTSAGKKFYAELSQSLLDKKNPGKYNQAIMDFGAIVCKPALPLCLECPLQKKCIAFLNNKVSTLPVNNTVNKQKERFFNYLVIKHKGKFYVNKRTEKDIWQNLYEFVLIETKTWLDEKELFKNKSFLTLLNQDDFTVKFISKKISQKLTHQLITGRFIHVEIKNPLSVKTHFAVNNSQLKALPFPKFIASYLTDKNVSLNLINVF